jgi:hypothetical protein
LLESKKSLFLLGTVLFVSILLMGCDNTGMGSRVVSNSLYLTAPKSVRTNQVANIEISARSISNVYGFQFEIQYDPTKFEFVELAESTALNQFGYPSSVFCVGEDATVPGKITKIACTRLGRIGGVTLNGPVYTLRLRGIARGGSQITILNPLVLDPDGTQLSVTTKSVNVRVS